MAYPIPVPKPVEELLTTCSDEELEAVRQAAWQHPNIDAETAAGISNLIRYELTLRQQEPLWRKASRFYRRYHEEIAGVAKLAAVFAAAFGGVATYDLLDGN